MDSQDQRPQSEVKVTVQSNEQKSQHSSDEGEIKFKHITYTEEPEKTQQTLQKIILGQLEQEESPKYKNLSSYLECRLSQTLEDMRKSDKHDFKTIIDLRMKELAYAKILVSTYEKTGFRLIMAIYHIGGTYLRFNCYQQAENHLKEAISLDTEQLNNQNRSKNIKSAMSQYHSYIITAYGQCLFKQQKFKTAKQILLEARDIQRECKENTSLKCNDVQTLSCLAKVCFHLGNTIEAHSFIDESITRAIEVDGENSWAHGIALEDKAAILLHMDVPAAIGLFKKAIETITLANRPETEEEVAKLYLELANIFKSQNDDKEQLSALYQRYKVMQAAYGNADKRCIRQQRTIATVLLKQNRLTQCLDELDDIVQKEQRVYGENSIEVGKSLKTAATVHIAYGQLKQADQFLKRALKIFHDLGDQKLARQVRNKISSLAQNKSGK